MQLNLLSGTKIFCYSKKGKCIRNVNGRVHSYQGEKYLSSTSVKSDALSRKSRSLSKNTLIVRSSILCSLEQFSPVNNLE